MKFVTKRINFTKDFKKCTSFFSSTFTPTKSHYMIKPSHKRLSTGNYTHTMKTA